MIYMIDVTINYNLITGDIQKHLEAEWKVSDELYACGRMLRIWRKANAKGAIAIWDMPDHNAVSDQIRNMPLYPFFGDVTVTPLVAHPRFPQFCDADKNRG